MTKQLMDGLRTAAEWIESGKVEYQWTECGKCNCGILAQAITGMSALEVHNSLVLGLWRGHFEPYYTEELPLVIKQMMAAGMKQEDFDKLESLTEVDRGEDFIELPPYKNPVEVVAYMRTWADSLERELLNQSTKVKTSSKVTVSC